MKIAARFLKLVSTVLQVNSSDELDIKITSGEHLEKTTNGLRVKVSDTTTATDNLWSSTKISDELATKASESYVDNAIAGLKWKQPVINFITQTDLDALTPNSGDRYVVTDGDNINKIAEYGTAWTYITPLDNWTITRKSNDHAYTYDADSASWADIGGISQSESEVVDEFTLTSTDITNKKVTLTYTPTSASVVKLDVIGGCAQDNGTDFSVTVSTKELSWSSLGLDGVLAAGDVLRVSYPTI